RVEQVGVGVGGLLGVHDVGVIGDDADPGAVAREGAVGVLVLDRIIFGDVLGQVGFEHSFAFPHDEMGGIGGIDDVDAMNAARVFLADALEHALGAPAVRADGDAR